MNNKIPTPEDIARLLDEAYDPTNHIDIANHVADILKKDLARSKKKEEESDPDPNDPGDFSDDEWRVRYNDPVHRLPSQVVQTIADEIDPSIESIDNILAIIDLIDGIIDFNQYGEHIMDEIKGHVMKWYDYDRND